MTENEISREIVDAAYHVHQELGPGLLETVYETTLAYELRSRGLEVLCQSPIPVHYKGKKLEDGFRADLIVNRKVIVEVKSVDVVPSVAYKILLTYLRFSGLHLGILINFQEEMIKDGIKRVVDNL